MVPVPLCTVDAWVAAIVFYSIAAVNGQNSFNFIFRAFVVITRDYPNCSTNYTKLALDTAVACFVIFILYCFFLP